MSISYIIISLLVLVLLLALVEGQKFYWWFRNITIKVRQYKKTQKHNHVQTLDNIKFNLSKEVYILKSFYSNAFDQEELKNLKIELQYKLKKWGSTKNFTSYLTGGMIPAISLLFAAYALINNSVPANKILQMSSLLLLLALPILVILIINFLVESGLLPSIESHLVVIEEVINSNETKLQQKASYPAKRRFRR